MAESPRQSIRVAAGILRDDLGRVLIAQRPADKHAGGAWEFPGGKLDTDEEPRQCLDRELGEELGIEVLAAQPFLDYAHAYPDRDVYLHVFRVTQWRGRPRGLENQPLRWAAPGDLLDIGILPADRPIVAALQALNKA